MDIDDFLRRRHHEEDLVKKGSYSFEHCSVNGIFPACCKSGRYRKVGKDRGDMDFPK